MEQQDDKQLDYMMYPTIGIDYMMYPTIHILPSSEPS